jgi:hypothetical protein
MRSCRIVRSVGAVLGDSAWVLAAAALLLAPAAIWGRPFVFGDTVYYWSWGHDLLDALQRPWPHPGQAWAPGRTLHGWGFATHDATPADLRFNLTWLTARSAFYAVPFYLVSRLGGLWLVAGLQALAAAAVVRIAVRAAAPAASGLAYLGVVAMLTALTSLGFEAAYAMPDLFGGLAVLAAALLGACPDRLGRGARLGLGALIVYAVLAHAENGLNMAAAVLVAGVWHGRAGAGWRGALARTAPIAIALATGLALAAGGGAMLDRAFGRPLYMAPFAGARLLADGGAQPFLRRACPRARLAACDLAAAPPVNIEYYLWVYPLEGPPPAHLDDPAAYTLAQFERLQRRHVSDAEADHRERFVAEQARLALGVLQTDGLGQMRESFVNGTVALINFGVGRDFDSVRLIRRGGRTLMRDETDALLPGRVECVGPAGGACGRFELGALAPLQYGAMLASLGLVAVSGLRRPAGARDALAALTAIVLAVVFANAFLCGAISGPYGRYQARVEWLVPLCALLALTRRTGPRSAPSGERAVARRRSQTAPDFE